MLVRFEVLVGEFVLEEHLDGYVDEKSSAGVDEYGEPIQQGGEQRGPEDDQRYRRRQADHEEYEVAARSADERDHVIQRHDGVGQDDDPDRLPRARPGLHLLLPLLLAYVLLDELPGDPEQEESAYDLQEWDLQQVGDDSREDEPQDDGPGGAPDDRHPALGAFEAAGGHGDDHG